MAQLQPVDWGILAAVQQLSSQQTPVFCTGSLVQQLAHDTHVSACLCTVVVYIESHSGSMDIKRVEECYAAGCDAERRHYESECLRPFDLCRMVHEGCNCPTMCQRVSGFLSSG